MFVSQCVIRTYSSTASFKSAPLLLNNIVITCRSSPLEVFLAKGVLKMCNKFTGEHPCRKVVAKQLQSNFIEITLRHECSPVNFQHIFATIYIYIYISDYHNDYHSDYHSAVFV